MRPTFALTVTHTEPDEHTAALILKGLFKLMEPGLREIAEARGVPLFSRKQMDPEEYARRHAEIVQFVIDNDADVPIPGSHLTREYLRERLGLS